MNESFKEREKRPDCACGEPYSAHIEIHKPFDMHTPIGISNGVPPPLVVLCPTAVYRPILMKNKNNE